MAQMLLDSSVLVAFFNEEDAQHDRARFLMEGDHEPFLIHEYVVLETTTVLMVRVGKPLADSFVDEVLGNASFEILMSSDTAFLSAIRTFTGTKAKLPFVDAALLDLSDMYEVVTLDEALVRAIKRRALQS